LIIQITPDGFIHLSGDAPEVGHKYQLEDIAEGSLAQGRAWHALAQEFWASGAHSYNVKTFEEFRDCLKRDIGAGFDKFFVATPDGARKTKRYDEAVELLMSYGITDIKRYCYGTLKSWAEYTKKERRDAIDRLISTMDQAGVNTRKYQEIIAGLNESRRS
jgi:hypothetical protein